MKNPKSRRCKDKHTQQNYYFSDHNLVKAVLIIMGFIDRSAPEVILDY